MSVPMFTATLAAPASQVERFEDLLDATGGVLIEEPDSGWCEFTFDLDAHGHLDAWTRTRTAADTVFTATGLYFIASVRKRSLLARAVDRLLGR